MFGRVNLITKANATSPIPVASTATVYTPSFAINHSDAYGVELLAVSDGDVDVKVELEQAMEAPATEEAADSNWSVPDSFPVVFVLEDEVVHLKQITPMPAKYARFKLTGQGSNHSSTTVRIRLFKQGSV